MDHGIFLEAYRIMALPNWENLAKNGMDPQTILAYVDEKIGEHNANATAHMASEASLAAHRASVVCDHLAESVVNDKIRKTARAYVAIVDPSSDEDFDTIEAAISYADSAGGGGIYIVPGTHYLSGLTQIPQGITLVGSNYLNTVIATDWVNDQLFEYQGGTTDPILETGFEKITFDNNDGAVLSGANVTGGTEQEITFTNCIFLNQQKLCEEIKCDLRIDDCVVQGGDEYMFDIYGTIRFNRTIGIAAGQYDHMRIVQTSGGGYANIFMEDCEFQSGESQSSAMFSGGSTQEYRLNNTRMVGWITHTLTFYTQVTKNCFIFNPDSGYYRVYADWAQIINCEFGAGTGNRVRVNSTANNTTIIGNIIRTPITNSGTNTFMDANRLVA